MKKIFVLIGSRQKKGNTAGFAKRITDRLDKEKFEVEYAFPQDFNIAPCMGCSQCFVRTNCVNRDDLNLLHEKILESDLFIIASPVYMHYFTADLKLIIDKSSWWAHTFRLQGKPVVILSTCGTNGFDTVTKPLGEIMSYMGGNVIASANAAMIPDQLDNEEWMEKVSGEIAGRINKYAYIPHESNKYIERTFPYMKASVQLQKEHKENSNLDIEFGEYNYWRDTGMLNYDSFEDYLKEKYKCKEVVV
ncbi:flavodoxin family protein [Butyrivibrio sp. INlla21]|uniref:flavodoxin family protein n=1 Tax=Butyrivibrio sp. INlla21 TaxID=1520811 RepID=UPI0008E540D6|nr:flavodoxin family protein [Butyrivibrio sp. INlla21]SFU96370.1 Multimeric flavodoxin WrbA [Butyrivibrio sp. INlla21]